MVCKVCIELRLWGASFFGLKSGQMPIFRVVRQKHVVIPNSQLFWARINKSWGGWLTNFAEISLKKTLKVTKFTKLVFERPVTTWFTVLIVIITGRAIAGIAAWVIAA
jgi:hypothetical protein